MYALTIEQQEENRQKRDEETEIKKRKINMNPV